MRNITLKAAFAAILISAPFASAFAERGNQSDTNIYQTESRASFRGNASMSIGADSMGYTTPSTTQQDNGRR